MRKKRFLLGATALLMLAGTTTAAVVSADDPQGERSTEQAGRQLMPIQELPPELASAFAVLKAGPTSESRAVQPSGKPTPDGLNSRLEATVETEAGQVRIIPGDNKVCLIATTAGGKGGSCASSADALAGRLIVSFRGDDPGEGVTFGLVPDGASTIAAKTERQVQKVLVSDNVWVLPGAEATAAQIPETTVKSAHVVPIP